MGGSGYNYAVIPLLEALGVSADKILTQAEYNEKIATETSPLAPILEAILSVIDTNKNSIVSYVLSIFANLTYTISKNGLTTIVSNLIAPVSELLKAASGILPISVNVDLKGLTDGSGALKLYTGKEVEAHNAKLGVNVDLDAITIEDLVNGILEEKLPALQLELQFSKIAAQTAKLGANGEIEYTDSKVDPKWDILNGTWGKNISGDKADSLIALTEMILTPENIDAILKLLKVDLSTLDETLGAIVEKAISNPSTLVDTIIKLLTADYEVTGTAMVYAFLGYIAYDYSQMDVAGGNKSAVTASIDKLDKIINRAVPKVIEILAGMDNANSFVVELYQKLGAGATIDGIVNYLLNKFAFNDDMMNTIIGALVGVLGSMDGKTFETINKVVKAILKTEITPKSFMDLEGNNIGSFLNDALTAINSGKADEEKLTAETLTWADVAAELYKVYKYEYVTGQVDGKDVKETYLNAADNLEGAEIFIGADGKAVLVTAETPAPEGAVTYTLAKAMTTGEKPAHATAVLPDYDWGIVGKDTFMNVIYDVTAVINPVIDFLFRGKDLTILVDGVKLKGANTYENAILPLAKALGVNLEENAQAFGNGSMMLKEVIDGIFSLIAKLENAPLSTILELIGSISFFIANDGVKSVVENVLSPITGLLSLFSAIISEDDINALLKQYIKMDLNDIKNIAGSQGDALVKLLNDMLSGLTVTSTDGTNVQVAEILPSDLFVQLSKYAIKCDDLGSEDSDKWAAIPVGEQTNNWHSDKADVLMFLLKNVFSENVLSILCSALKLDANSDAGKIVMSLAGSEDDIVDIIVMLLTDYKVEYDKFDQADIKKVVPVPKDPLTKENINASLETIDAVIPAVIGLIKNGATLEDVINELIANADLGNLLMNILVPALVSLDESDVDIDSILGYVKEFTNIDIKLDPLSFSNKFGSELVDFLDVPKGTTWKAIQEYHTQYKYTYKDADNKEHTYFDKAADLTKVTVDGKEYALTPVTADGAQVQEIHFNWNINNLNDVIALVCDLLAPFDLVFRVLLSGEQIIVLEDPEGQRADVRVNGGQGYNTAVIPLLEAFGITPKTEAEFFAQAEAEGSTIKPVLEALAGFVKDICDKPVATLLEKLANIFYFIGNNGIVTVAQNFIAPVNTLFKQVNDACKIAIVIDIAQIGKTNAKVLQLYIGEEPPAASLAGKITLKVEGTDLAKIINDLIGEIKLNINGTEETIRLHLDLDWIRIAASMAKTANEAEQTTAGAELLKIPTKMADVEKADGTVVELSKYFNITGDKADTFITLLQLILTPDNTAGIAKLIKSLIPDTLDKQISDVIYDVLNNPDSIEQLIGVVVSILGGGYEVEDNLEFLYKLLSALDFDYRKADIASAITKLDKIVSKAAAKVVKVIGDADAAAQAEAEGKEAKLLDKLALYLSKPENANATLKTVVDWLLTDQVFKQSTFETLLAAILPVLATTLNADLIKTLNDLLGIDLAPVAFATATGNAKIADFVNGADTWAKVLEERATKGEDGKYTLNTFDWGITDKDSFVSVVLDLLKPLEKVLAFVLIGKDLDFTISENVKLKAGNAYANALNPLFKALGIGGDKDAATANEAIGNIVDYLFILVDKLCDAPFTTLLSVISNLAYFIASDNLEPFIKNLLSPVLGILELTEPIISREQLDTILKGFIKLNGKAYGLTDLLEIGNNGGAQLVELLNNVLGNIVIKRNDDPDAPPIYVVKALSADFFTKFAQYAINITAKDETKGTATAWTVDTADALMYILTTALSEDFLNIIFKLANIDTSKDLGATLITLAGKQNDLVDVILMLLENYTFTYKRLNQADLDASLKADYFGGLTYDKTTSAINALDPLLKSVLSMLGNGDLKSMIDGILAKFDLGNTLVNALVPVLAGVKDLDSIVGYVRELTNLKLDLSPANFKASAKFGSKLASFIGDAETWADVAAKYQQYKYTYIDANGEEQVYYSATAGLAKATIGEGENAKEYALKIVYEQKVDADGNPVFEEDGKTPVYTETQATGMNSEFDWGISTKEDLANFACDLLAPVDVVFQILLSGKPIIALEDATADRADIRVQGGYGYNTAIVPLLEAFGIEAKTQKQYDALVKSTGSSLKYILDTLFAAVDTILDAPVNELFSRLANIFYFIGSDGINTIAENLIAPVNALLKEVNDVYPLAIAIDMSAEKIVSTYIGTKAPDEIAGKISVNVSGAALADFINKAIGSLEINGTAVSLKLDLDWNAIAAQMAKRDAEGNIVFIGTHQTYDGTAGEFETGKDLKNIAGDPANALVTLLNVALTEENCKSIKTLVEALLKDAEISEDIKNLVNDILNKPDAIKNAIASIVLILTGGYDINTLSAVFKYLGVIDWNNADLEKAIPALDRLIKNAIPVVVDLVGDTTKPEAEQNIIDKFKATGKEATLDSFVSWILNENVFTDKVMGSITGALVKALGGALKPELVKTLKDLLGIDLAPVAFANATGNAQFIAYVNVAAADETVGVTWADVLAAHSRETGETDEEGNKIIEVDNIFTGIKNKQTFMDALLSLLTPLESVLAFLLRGQNLDLAVDGVTLKGNDAYNNVFKYLFTALGLTELGVEFKEAASYADMSAVAAVSNVVDYVFALVDELCNAPFTTLLTVIANLSYFIANNNVEVILTNLVSPVLSIVDALSDVITRDQVDTLLKSFIKLNGKAYGLSDLLKIAGNGGENLIELVNSLLGNIKITDESGNEVYVLNALSKDFFVGLSQAAIKVDKPETGLVINKTDVTKWHTELSDAIMYVLKSVLTTDFLTILTNALGLNEKNPNVADIIMSLAGKEDSIVKLLVTFLNKHLVEYVPYNQPELKKTGVEYSSADAHSQLNDALGNLDSLIPVIFSFIESIDASSLKELVYSKILTDDIANTLISTVVKLLAGLPAETIDKVLGYVRELTTLTDLDISPKAFAAAPFGSQLKQYIGTADTWAEVWENHSKETGELDENGNAIREAIPWAFGIKNTDDLLKLVSDLVQPLSDILALILMGGTEKAEFEALGEHHGKYIAALEEIAIMGGNGYNYAVIPLLELLGAKAPTQEEYAASVKANHGNTLYPVLKTLLDRVDEILDKPVASVLDMLANLTYVIGSDNIEVIVQNLIAPVNSLIKLVDPIYPIAININLGNIGVEGAQIVETYLGKSHPGVGAGIQFTLKGTELAELLNNVLGGIAINGKALGIKLDLDWLKLASQAAADKNSDKIADTSDSAMSTIYDLYTGLEKVLVSEKNKAYVTTDPAGSTTAKTFSTDYVNVVGDRADTFVMLLNLILTKENVEAIKTALGKEDGFGEPIDSIIDAIIEDPTKIIDIIISLLGGGKVSYIPVQNRDIRPTGVDYRTYFTLTKANADVIAANLDELINSILTKANMGTLKEFITKKYITNELINTLLDKLVPLLGGEKVGPILEAVKNIDIKIDGKHLDDSCVGIDLTATGFAKMTTSTVLRNKLNAAGEWSKVGSFAGTKWGFNDGDIQGFLKTIAQIVAPLGPVLKLFLAGEGSVLSVLDIVKIGGSNGYDYGIIPILEAFGLPAEQVKTLTQYKSYIGTDNEKVLGYVLERIGFFADNLLNKPVDTLLGILPNLAYFISNEGVYLAVRNILAPVYAVLEVVAQVYKIDFIGEIKIEKLLHNIDFKILVANNKYDFRIPEINFYKLAELGGETTKQVATSRTKKANSFNIPVDPYPYINNYPTGYETYSNKNTQTYVVADKGDTLTLILTWALEMFGDAHNREALVQWLTNVFELQSGMQQTVRYGINKMFDTCSNYNVPDIIVASLLQALGMGITIDSAVRGDVLKINQIFDEIFKALSSNKHCAYAGIAEVMENLTGVWIETVGTHEEYHEAEKEAEESLNWFQRLLAKIKAFFQKIFSIFR